MKDNSITFITYPVLDEIKADTVFPTLDEWDGETVMVPAECIKQDPDDYFIFKVKGNLMYPQYLDGDNLLILKQDTTNYSGQLAVVVCGNESAVLSIVKYNMDEDWEYFLPINPDFNSNEIGNGIPGRFHILGIPTLMLRDINNI